MGWKEGTGLGKNSDGIVSHIKVKKREDNVGLGIEKERTRKLGVEGMWWSANVSETLMRLQVQKQKNDEKKPKKSKTGKKDKKDKKDKDKKSKKKSKEITMKIYTDEELFEATGGARFGMRAQRRAEGKWQRTENSENLKEWEEQVKTKIEWNGLGQAKVLLKSQDSSSTNATEEASSSKKKRKRSSDDCAAEEEKKEDDIAPVESAKEDSEEGNSETKAEKKKRKKLKSEKKSSKKSKKSSKEDSS